MCKDAKSRLYDTHCLNESRAFNSIELQMDLLIHTLIFVLVDQDLKLKI